MREREKRKWGDKKRKRRKEKEEIQGGKGRKSGVENYCFQDS